MDKLLQEFRCNVELHGKVVEHLIAKKVPLSQANLFFQPESWEILSDKIANHEYHFSPLSEGYIDKRNGQPMSYEQAAKRIRQRNQRPFRRHCRPRQYQKACRLHQ